MLDIVLHLHLAGAGVNPLRPLSASSSVSDPPRGRRPARARTRCRPRRRCLLATDRSCVPASALQAPASVAPAARASALPPPAAFPVSAPAARFRLAALHPPHPQSGPGVAALG